MVEKASRGARGAEWAMRMQCVEPSPSKKAVLRAWARGARFDHKSDPAWPSMYLSSVGAKGQPEASEKAWLWDAMARAGVDLEETGPGGLGFEALAARDGDAAALRWWKSRGGGIGRRSASGRSIWSIAWGESPRVVGLMRGLWPEEADAKAVSADLYGLRSADLREGAAPFWQSSVSPLGWALLRAMRDWPEELARWPELVRPSEELSAFMRECGAVESADEVERLERSAMAKAERAELERSAGGSRPRSSGLRAL